jgi:phosphopantothenoylcysteine synthetase/decarboxylase
MLKEMEFGSAASLKELLFTELGEMTKMGKRLFLVHAAAVADYSPISGPIDGKINSDSESLHVELKRNPKIVNLVKEHFPNVHLIAFKLTSETSKEARQDSIAKLFSKSFADVIVHNDATEWKWGESHHRFTWLEGNDQNLSPVAIEDRNHLAEKIMELIKSSEDFSNQEADA